MISFRCIIDINLKIYNLFEYLATFVMLLLSSPIGVHISISTR